MAAKPLYLHTCPINERKQGRNINFTFKSEGIGSGYQMGTTFVLAEIDDGRP